MRPIAAVALLGFVCATGISCANHDHSDMPDQGMYRPEQVVWKDGPPSLPLGAKIAVLEGDPAKPGFFAMRLKFPDGYKVMPHTHPKVERVTIIQGTLHLGMGGTFDKSATHALMAGSYSFMPPGMKHFAWTEGETILQLATIGPWQINYINPDDDPRNKK
jgi:quercetin dioxygenase-like cupin family protein